MWERIARILRGLPSTLLFLCLLAALLAFWLAIVSKMSVQIGLLYFALILLALLVVFLLRKRPRPAQVEISDWGVRRYLNGGRTEEVAWSRVIQILVITTDEGPLLEDLFFVLRAEDGSGVLVPHAQAMQINLLECLQARFPGMDDQAIIKAAGSTSNARFVIWQAVGTS